MIIVTGKVDNKDVLSLDLLKIDYLDFNDNLDEFDCLIITSKNAVFALEALNKKWKNIPIYAIAPKTAQVIKQYGGKIEYIGKSKTGDEFANEIKEKIKNKKVAYISAKKIVSNLVNILSKVANIKQIIAYKTGCNKVDFNIPKNSKIIFSSPSTIECFFKNFNWDDSFKAICIGKTTAKYLPKDINYILSDTISLDSCIQKAKELK